MAQIFRCLDTDGDGRIGLEGLEDAFLRLLLSDSDDDAGVQFFLRRATNGGSRKFEVDDR
jgi:hypothetical protein